MSTLISGSLAYDYIMDFPDSFKNHLLPDQLHILNVCFVVEKLKKNLGGCATNIAYTMKLLEENPLILGPVGSDGADLLHFFKEKKIETKYIDTLKDELTSSAHITTDKDDNQIIAYHNGAGNNATDMNVSTVTEELKLALITPTKKEAMIKHAMECYDKKIPFCFDPSHQLTAFSDQELAATIGQAKFYIGNDYELKLTEEKTGWDTHKLLEHTEIVIITLGDKGSVIVTKEESIEIKPCPATSVEDPTGAGDAYRGGFFASYTRGYDLKTCGQMASVAATYAVEHYGTVNHTYTMEEFEKRYENTYGEPISLKM
ncbi:carbohydrate kinase family protein [Candidatus Parcubacteria bacterium]|nr:MAG: carbohydrate kinase family protein [Candidatus Parcubacteria bacterium]